MAIDEGVKEIPDSEEEPMTSSPIAFSGAIDKLHPAASGVSQASLDVACVDGASAKDVSTIASVPDQRLVVDQEKWKDVDISNETHSTNEQLDSSPSQHIVAGDSTLEKIPANLKTAQGVPNEGEPPNDTDSAGPQLAQLLAKQDSTPHVLPTTNSQNLDVQLREESLEKEPEERLGQTMVDNADQIERPQGTESIASPSIQPATKTAEGGQPFGEPSIPQTGLAAAPMNETWAQPSLELEGSSMSADASQTESHSLTEAITRSSVSDMSQSPRVDGGTGPETEGLANFTLASEHRQRNNSVQIAATVTESAKPKRFSREANEKDNTPRQGRTSPQTDPLADTTKQYEAFQAVQNTPEGSGLRIETGSSDVSTDAEQKLMNNPPSPPKAASTSKPSSLAKASQEATLAELKAQRSALLASLAVLPHIQELIAEDDSSPVSSRGSDAEPTDAGIMAAANKIVKKHIKLLHEYNEIKDAGQGLMGLIADQRGVRIVEVQDEFGIEPKD